MTFPLAGPLTLCLILKRTSPGHASGFCAASRFWRPCQPSAADAVEDDRRIFREGYNYNREFASRRDGIMLLAAPAHCRFPALATEPWREGGRGDGHGQMTKATPYQSRGQPRTPVRLVNECPQRRMEVGRDGGRDSGREGTSPIKWRDWHGRAAALPQTALGCVIDGGRWRRGRPRPANVGETDDAGAARGLFAAYN